MNRAGEFRVLYAVSGAFLCLFVLMFGRARGDAPHNVLILNSYHNGYFWTDDIVRGIEGAFADNGIKAQFFIEYLDTRRYDPNVVFPHLKRLYASKYRNIRFDVIISSDNDALEFIRLCRKEMFPGIPIVFCGLNPFNDSMLDGLEPITGVVETYDKESTIAAALKLHPSAGQVVLVKHKLWDPLMDLEEFIGIFGERAKFTVVEITDFTAEEFEKKIKEFGQESVVLLPLGLGDSAGNIYSDKFTAKIINLCPAPVYVNNFYWIGWGVVGGCINSGASQGGAAAEMAVRILKGESAEGIPIIRKSPADYMFDYNQLKRFGISVSQLPPGSTIVNEPKSFYYQYKKRIWFVAAIFSGLSLMVLILSANIIQRRRMEKNLLGHQAQLKFLASELTLAEERERRRIATELHDRISQSLVMSKVNLEQMLENEASEQVAETLDEVCNILKETIENSRQLTFDLSSPILHELGFEAAVSEWLIDHVQKKHNIGTEFEDEGVAKPLDDDIRGILFRTVRELLINVIKHSQARRVRVSVRKLRKDIQVIIEDDGTGFDVTKVETSVTRDGKFGLFSIRERLEQLGGHFEIKSKPRQGCRITITAPLKKEAGSAK